ncbi:hypothetical protein [Flavobacterium anhuiense]|uniref:hypothetical protein n=1 Tax=Flavobacterium anhuiense TaxID=459526 RepID=UPI00101DAC58|nr:hypothetical protein [Flavobacterium anhuiense]
MQKNICQKLIAKIILDTFIPNQTIPYFFEKSIIQAYGNTSIKKEHSLHSEESRINKTLLTKRNLIQKSLNKIQKKLPYTLSSKTTSSKYLSTLIESFLRVRLPAKSFTKKALEVQHLAK